MAYLDARGTGRVGQVFDAQVVIKEGKFRLKAEQLRRFEQQESTCSLRVQGCCWEEPAAKELLDASPVVADLGAATECEVHKVDTVGMNDGKGFGTVLGVGTGIGGVVTELEDVAGMSERRLLKIGPVPFLWLVSG